MDQFMVDVTDIPNVKEGDMVTLIGSDGGYEITMEELAENPVASIMSWPAISANVFPDVSGKTERSLQPRIIFQKME